MTAMSERWIEFMQSFGQPLNELELVGQRGTVDVVEKVLITVRCALASS